MGKRLCSLLLAAVLVGGMVPAWAVEEDGSITAIDSEISITDIGEEDEPEGITVDTDEDEPAELPEEETEEAEEQILTLDEAGEAAPVEVVSDLDEVSALIQDNWEDSYYGEITVDPQENQVEKDGEEISLRSELDLTKTEENTVLSSAAKAEDYFDDQTEYDAYTDNDGVVHVSNPYQTCRIVIYANQIEESYGASRVMYLENYGEYILQYDTEEQTQLAYEALLPQYGSENCFLDEVLSSNMLLDTSSTTKTSAAATKAVCYSWGAEYMGLDVLQSQVESYGLSKKSVTVAIIDTGIDKSHSFFTGRTISGYNFLISKNRSATNYTDDNGHGTHVAGIIADCTSSNVNIMALRVFNASGSTTSMTVIDNALKYAYEHNANVINMSLGNEDQVGVWDKTLQTIHNAGIPVVAAAGNYTETNKGLKVNYPASLSTTYAVSAVDENGTIASYSCRGSTIDFAAPGTSILSAGAGGDMEYRSGTSMAAPHVTAAIAMIYLKHPGYSLTSLEQVLKTYAIDRGTAGKDSKYGYGVLYGLENYYKEDSANLVLKTATLKYKKMQYTGAKRKDPVVQVKASSGKVLPTSAYKVTYSNNKSVGTATVTITGVNGYKGTITKTFTIKPKNIKIKTLTNKATRKMYVKWSASLGYTGYQIQYATNSSFTKGKHSVKQKGKTVTRTYTKLTKGKRYYVRVRAYKTVGSTTYYGTWSAVKSVKISK
ncbi:MAG: S8 family serine peptidase [Eubacteriales bacterium]|nr:S8 family serine peptidase [Eubacteriales bacterium]